MKTIFATLLLSYFRLLAQIQLIKTQPRIIGITGSAGKSSTMEAIAAILQEKFKIKVGRKANSESGIPLNILGLSPSNFSLLSWLKLAIQAPLKLLTNWEKYDFYIVEMGIDSPLPPKNMSYLLTILQPEIGVFTSVDAVHSEPFDHLVVGKSLAERRDSLVQLIAAEKGKLTKSLPKNGLAVLNADSAVLMENATPTKAKLMTFGEKHDATIQIDAVNWNKAGTQIVFSTAEEKVTLSLNEYLVPHHYAGTFAAALCVGIYAGLSPYLCCKLLEKNYKLPPGRASLIPAINGATILDSSYNSSAKPTLDFFELIPHIDSKRTLALLGDMRELGSVTQVDHELIAQKAVKVFDEVVLVGPYMLKYAVPILKEKNVDVRWFVNAYLAAEYLKTTLKPDDLLFVKGSQNTLLLEIAIERLMAHPETADGVLCRRGSFWDGERKKLIQQSH
jgi:UDP-N-acetylmuramoyl-tripeptide--D-alanyl-D-alanine ligase